MIHAVARGRRWRLHCSCFSDQQRLEIEQISLLLAGSSLSDFVSYLTESSCLMRRALCQQAREFVSWRWCQHVEMVRIPVTVQSARVMDGNGGPGPRYSNHAAHGQCECKYWSLIASHLPLCPRVTVPHVPPCDPHVTTLPGTRVTASWFLPPTAPGLP